MRGSSRRQSTLLARPPPAGLWHALILPCHAPRHKPNLGMSTLPTYAGLMRSPLLLRTIEDLHKLIVLVHQHGEAAGDTAAQGVAGGVNGEAESEGRGKQVVRKRCVCHGSFRPSPPHATIMSIQAIPDSVPDECVAQLLTLCSPPSASGLALGPAPTARPHLLPQKCARGHPVWSVWKGEDPSCY